MEIPINISDARSYTIPIINMIGRRTNRIVTLKNKLVILITKLYMTPDENDKTELCLNISGTLDELELLLLKNIDDSQILEHSLAEFTLKPPQSNDQADNKSTDYTTDHVYFA